MTYTHDGDWADLGRRAMAGEEIAVDDLGLGVRVENVLASAGIRTLRQLVAMREADLMLLKSFGKTSCFKVVARMRDMGLRPGRAIPAQTAASCPCGGSFCVG